MLLTSFDTLHTLLDSEVRIAKDHSKKFRSKLSIFHNGICPLTADILGVFSKGCYDCFLGVLRDGLFC